MSTSTKLIINAALLTLFLLVTMVACGRYEISPEPTDGIDPVPLSDDKVIIAAFGAPWCSACHSELPKLSAELKKLDPSKRSRIEFRVYVISGQSSSTKPNQAIADAYVKNLRLVGATALPDPWRMTLFNKWVGGTYIPGGAVLDSSERVIKSFRGGANWDVIDIVAEALKRIR